MSYNVFKGRVHHSGQLPENTDEEITCSHTLQALWLQSHHVRT
ncbi:Uncharacterised protein [Escherichia coli]|nr:Uncharacterised protein [Escherichia coli]VVZ72336.1 Uncharacterised protein [Escherichia coli]